MREIKFRGKRIDNGEWVYGDFFRNSAWSGQRFYIVSKSYEDTEADINSPIVPASVGQFTGLTDKNRKEIYEGDIVKSEQWEPKVYQVDFDRGAFCFFNVGDSYYQDCKYLEQFEVIGNIHDNQELLK